MPKELEEKLRAQAKKQGLSGERLNAYVYGTMRRMGWVPAQEHDQGPKGTETSKKKK